MVIEKRIKGLFITHVPLMHIYGAATSLRLYLKNNKDIDATIITPMPLNPLKWWNKEVLKKEKEYFQGKVKNIYRFFLPIDLCYEGHPKNIFIIIFIKKILFHLFKWQINRLCFQEKYDFIYLNSVCLNSLIINPKKYKYILHVREVLDDCVSKKILSRIRQCKGVIFIDAKTQQSFLDKNLIFENCKILINPVDMTPLKEIQNQEIDNFLELYNLKYYYHDKYKIFSVIGTIIPLKGVDFIIKSFLEAKLDRSILLVVGSEADKKYSQECRKLSQGYQGEERVRFLGEINDINKIYYISDFIVRGEPDFRIGRTILEGLYSGCGVILPVEQNDVYEEFSYFKEKIYRYKPRDINDMVRVLKICNNDVVEKKEYKSNAIEYTKKMNEFICNIVRF